MAEITVNGITRPYEYIPYPKWIKVNNKDILVKSKEEHDALRPKKEATKKNKSGS